MLSRVAERLYWSARYLERVENIARLLSVYDDLLFDLPRGINISWYNLIEINGSINEFKDLYQDKSERSIVKYLLCDTENPNSMLSSLRMVRENIRTTRDVVPSETWEFINELDIFAKKNIYRGISRSDRHEYLNTVIEGCQKIIGLLTGAMSRDAGWSFFILGRYIERADMNTRVLDSAISLMMQSQADEQVMLGQVVWSKVLKSQSGYLNYRRSVRTSVTGAMAATYLMTEPNFPRSQLFCLKQIKNAAEYLPRANQIMDQVDGLISRTHGVDRSEDLNYEFSAYLNDIQLEIISLHQEISENWFNFDQGTAA
ncbi:alpha-E domain-containing protein [Vibrio sp. RC27]